ncbi:hypothetical protein PG995_003680 [Apiospora arundinis]
MALYHVRVRNHYWDRSPSEGPRVHTPVQSPVRQQGNGAAPHAVRVLDGKQRLSVHLVSHDKILTTCESLSYLAEAHGMIIRTSWQACPRPIWVVQEQVQFEPPFPVRIVDLATNEAMESDCTSICWVPHLVEPDGTLLTILNDIPGEIQLGSTRTARSNIVMQVPSCPRKTKAKWVETSSLSRCRKLNEKEKQALFNAQLESLRAKQMSTVSPQATMREYIRSPVERLLTSQFRLDTFPGLSIVPDDEDLEVPTRPAASDQSIEDILTGSCDWSDDGHLSDDPFDRRSLCMFEGARRLCCTYPDLAPTILNTDPTHRHLQDHECPRRSGHSEHCIFTDLQPTKCFLRNHQHCHLPLLDESLTLDEPVGSGSSSSPMALVPAQFPTTMTSSHLKKDVDKETDDDDDEAEFRSVCDWPLYPNLESRLRSQALADVFDDSFLISASDMVPTPYELEPSPLPSMMEIDEGWSFFPTDGEAMSSERHGLPSTPPPSYGVWV